jgi:hypothetical protein
MDLVHRQNSFNVDSDSFSRLGTDLRFDPLMSDYLGVSATLRKLHPAPDGQKNRSNAWLSSISLSNTNASEIVPGVTIEVPLTDPIVSQSFPYSML